MDVNDLIQLATLISVLAAVIGLWISIRAYKTQVSAQVMLAYTARVDELMRALPRGVSAPHVFPDNAISEPNDELRVGILRCFHHVAQIHYFSRKHYIPRDIWRRANKVFDHMLGSPIFVREWKRVAPMFEGDRAFCRYVERVQRTASAGGLR